MTTYKRATHNKECAYYKWINENTGALQWAASHKCDCQASQYACLAVTQLHQCSKIEVIDTTHKAGIHMGDIDTMSRIMDDENPIKPPASTRCPSLKPDKYWHCQDIPEMKTLFQLLDPSTIRTHNAYHHTAYLQVYDNVNNLLSVINQDQSGLSPTSPSTSISGTNYTLTPCNRPQNAHTQRRNDDGSRSPNDSAPTHA